MTVKLLANESKGLQLHQRFMVDEAFMNLFKIIVMEARTPKASEVLSHGDVQQLPFTRTHSYNTPSLLRCGLKYESFTLLYLYYLRERSSQKEHNIPRI